jgi:hypothetical protein
MGLVANGAWAGYTRGRSRRALHPAPMVLEAH